MKTWITYLAATALGLAATLLFGDMETFRQAMYTITALFVQVGGFVLIPLVFFGFSSGIASLRKDAKGAVFARTSILWSIISTLLLAICGALAFRLFPVSFPASSTAGTDPSVIKTVASQSISTLFNSMLPVNPFYSLSSAESFLLPVLVIACIFGYFLKPNVEVIRPAYVTMNSLSETMFRLARSYAMIGHFFIFFASSYWFSRLQAEGTIFVSAKFLLLLMIATVIVVLGILPLLFSLLTKFKVNPYRLIYRMLSPAIAALFTGSIFFTSPMTISLSRHNLGCQKRVSATAVPLYTLIGRGGSAMVATASISSLLYAALGTIPTGKVLLFVALCCAGVSYASSLYLGYEVFFIAIIALKWLKIDLYGAEMTLIGIMPLLNGIGVLIDSFVAALGTSYTCQRMGTRVETAYPDII
ncbi:Na+/H+ dicarboxylate symporter [Sphaerochaeta pleomorpha str. Grapes]|uniref:Na+/H+ dicarboxylate symporter n=1 Tax=Sphaerochaeta pleomorpha (strain ATCC BAA-1885 / DSM 22778 / Grapes) TaxID=158190 RepID=G8QYR0_SPHPG|nr:cation:dicarboxylase symporter family transporter [Sphaerochaeta pleomorpha]AEV29687.1 Na+/H+ dicarboxylate symporter [Sphaerochaeta pleomorpha str. Grapes]